MDSNKSYNLLVFTRILVLCFGFILSGNLLLMANDPLLPIGTDPLSKAEDFKAERESLLHQLDSQKQENEALRDENLFLNRENLTKELSIENRNFFIFTVLIFSFVALFLSYMLYRSIQKAKFNNKILQQQNKEIETQKRELEHLNQQKIKFFSIISHDIRSPLLSLKGVLNLFDANLLNDKAETNTFFSQLNVEFNATSDLLDNLLIWAKKQMYEESIEKVVFPINTLINDNLNLQQPAIEKRDIAIYNLLTNDIYVYADREMINMVLRNLICNALKFTHNGGQISILYKISGDFLEVGVRDTGIGISDEQIDWIFESRFYSTSGLNAEKGNGLGLMLCREFIEKSDGKLWIESKVGAGSTFFFTLPFIKEKHALVQRDTKPVSAAVESAV